MTSVLGHVTTAEFPAEYKKWDYPPPDRLFDAPVKVVVAAVSQFSVRCCLTLMVGYILNFPCAGQDQGRRKHREASSLRQCLVYLDRLR
jgi:hypothetical protein